MSDRGSESERPDPTGNAISPAVKVALILIAAAAVAGFPYAVDGYTLHLAILSGIAVIAASSLNLVMGYVGKLSLGHAAFYGIGAYTSALLAMSLQRADMAGDPGRGAGGSDRSAGDRPDRTLAARRLLHHSYAQLFDRVAVGYRQLGRSY